MNRILVAEPIYHALSPQVYFNRIAFWNECYSGHELGKFSAKQMVMGPRRNIRSARDLAVQQAIDSDATHLLFIDDDILIWDYILHKLLAEDKPIIGGLINKDDGTPCIWKECGDGEVAYTNHPEKGSFECAAVAAGCMLIKIEVLKKLKEGHRWLFTYDETERSMDVLFCRKARAYGFSIWCWPDEECVQVSHYD